MGYGFSEGSPGDPATRVEKLFAWLTSGGRLVIVVDPSTCTPHFYRGFDGVIVRCEGERLYGGDVVLRLTIAVNELVQG